MRYPLVDGQAIGSVDGDPAAAMRYTEVRMERIAHELLADIEKDTVEFGANYDETTLEPLVYPLECLTYWSMAAQGSRWVWPPTFHLITCEKS